jgi:hypothetical protein
MLPFKFGNEFGAPELKKSQTLNINEVKPASLVEGEQLDLGKMNEGYKRSFFSTIKSIFVKKPPKIIRGSSFII